MWYAETQVDSRNKLIVVMEVGSLLDIDVTLVTKCYCIFENI